MILVAGFWCGQTASAGEKGVKTKDVNVSTGRNLSEGSRLPDDAEISFTGTVRRVELEGGFFGIAASGGRKYQPLKLGREFQVDGLRVAVKARLRREVVTFRMWGEVIEIREISRTAP